MFFYEASSNLEKKEISSTIQNWVIIFFVSVNFY